MRFVRLLVLIALAAGGAAEASLAQDVASACDTAAVTAEADWNVPAGVLSAVGTVESGRQQGPLGAAPWPWTINAAGRGFYFGSKEAAIAAVLGLMQRGYPYIDVGCFQIDIAYHPDLFRSLEEMFDPERNAHAAARLLATERSHAPDWATAVAHYHSATPELGTPYLARVRAALPSAKQRGHEATLDRDLSATFTGSGAAMVRDGESRPALPRVFYPAAIPSSARGPQIIFIGAPERLPKVIVNNAGLSSARR